MLEIIVITLGSKMSIMDSDFFSSRVVYRLFGAIMWWTPQKIHSKFILCRKNIILIALAISHTYLYIGKKWKILTTKWHQNPYYDHNMLFYLIQLSIFGMICRFHPHFFIHHRFFEVWISYYRIYRKLVLFVYLFILKTNGNPL